MNTKLRIKAPPPVPSHSRKNEGYVKNKYSLLINSNERKDIEGHVED